MTQKTSQKKQLNNWNKVKKYVRASAHIAFPSTETISCKVCSCEQSLSSPSRSRSSIMLEFTRIHFYKHKINETFSDSTGNQLDDYAPFSASEVTL